MISLNIYNHCILPFQTMGEKAPSFSLVGTDTGFSSRSQDVFSSLATIEAKHGAFQKAATSTTRQRQDNEKLMKSDPRVEEALQRNKPNVFKRPREFARPARKRAPDFRDHPERWTKYDLSDVPGDQMTERSNTAAAMDFLNAQRKRNEEMDGVDDTSECTIQFKKPTTKVSRQTSHAKRGSDTSDVAFGNSKLVMPEYVVGQSASKRRQTSRVTGQVKCDAVGLGHLTHSDDQVEDEGDAAQGMEDTTEDEQACGDDVRSTSSAVKDDKRVIFKKISKSRANQKRIRTDDDVDDADNDD